MRQGPRKHLVRAVHIEGASWTLTARHGPAAQDAASSTSHSSTVFALSKQSCPREPCLEPRLWVQLQSVNRRRPRTLVKPAIWFPLLSKTPAVSSRVNIRAMCGGRTGSTGRETWRPAVRGPTVVASQQTRSEPGAPLTATAVTQSAAPLVSVLMTRASASGKAGLCVVMIHVLLENEHRQ